MNQFVVWVEFRVPRECRADFSRLVRVNAASSLRNEAGCRRFDVLTPEPSDDADIALYEIYDNETAFGAHLESEHYRAFATATAELVTHKLVRRFSVTKQVA